MLHQHVKSVRLKQRLYYALMVASVLVLVIRNSWAILLVVLFCAMRLWQLQTQRDKLEAASRYLSLLQAIREIPYYRDHRPATETAAASPVKESSAT